MKIIMEFLMIPKGSWCSRTSYGVLKRCPDDNLKFHNPRTRRTVKKEITLSA